MDSQPAPGANRKQEICDLRSILQDVIPLITWENGKSFERDGEPGYLKDYAINEIGPAEAAEAQIQWRESAA